MPQSASTGVEMAKTENWQVANEGLNKRFDDLDRHLTRQIKDSEAKLEKRIDLSEAHWDRTFAELNKRFDDQVMLLRDIQKSVQGLQVKAAAWGGMAAVVVALGSMVVERFFKA
jgi:hypothetical protein